MVEFNTFYHPDFDPTERLYDEPEEADLEIIIELGFDHPEPDPYRLNQEWDPKYFMKIEDEPEEPEDLSDLFQNRIP